LRIKKSLFLIFHFALLIFFAACSVKTTPIYAVIKTPQIRVADEGFIKEGFGYKKLIIYKAANKPIEITIKNSYICFKNKCIDKATFIHNYISKTYPTDFFDKILNYECIRGFFCKSYKNKILFKDNKKKILIMIKEIK